jgi:hypothetical protein
VRFVVDKAALGQVFSENFSFPVSHPNDYSTRTIIIIHHPGLVQGQTVANVPSGFNLISRQETN